MGSNDATVVELIQAREDSFLEYFSIHEEITRHKSTAPTTHSSCCDEYDDQPRRWDTVLSPRVWCTNQSGSSRNSERSNQAPFLPYQDYIVGLHRVSSQLEPHLLGELMHQYPNGRIPTDENDDDSGNQEKYDEIATNTKTLEYCAKRDAKLIISEIDSRAIVGSGNNGGSEGGTDNGKTAAASRGTEHSISEANGINAADTPKKLANSIPSLTSIAERAACPIILQTAREIEKSFVDDLNESRTQADCSYRDLITESQTRLEACPEAREVKRLRRLLGQAETELMARQDAIKVDIETERDVIQAKYNEKRLSAVARYYKQRNEFHDAASTKYCLLICMGCSQPFKPRPRSSLPEWDRCSEKGCISSEKFCRDCTSGPCARCLAPVCAAHAQAHELLCQRQDAMCGFNPKTGSIEEGIIKKGCCGARCYNAESCQSCGVRVCDGCSVGDFTSESESPHCLGCSGENNSLHPRSKRAGPEYQRARKRRRQNRADTNLAFDLPPVENYIVSSIEWETKQDSVHKEWFKQRLENLTPTECKYLNTHYGQRAFYYAINNLGNARIVNDPYDTYREGEECSADLFPAWTKKHSEEDEVLKVLGRCHNKAIEKLTPAEPLPDYLCPCWQCKQSPARLSYAIAKKQQFRLG